MAGTPAPEDFLLQWQAEVDPVVRAYLELADDITFTLDAFGRFASANPRAEALFGRSSRSLRHRYLADFAPADEREVIADALRRAREGEPVDAFDLRLPARGSRPETTLSVRSRALHDGGRFVGTLHIARDATDERRTARETLEWAENALREAQRVGALGILAAGVAHDFKNILTAILSNASLAEAELPPGSQATPHLERIRQAALRAADLTEQMLSYSGQGERREALLDLNRLVDGMADLVRASIRRTIGVSMQLEPGLSNVRGDPTQLRQLLMNLLLNAAEAIAEHGHVTVRTFAREVTAEELTGAAVARGLQPGEAVLVEIADDGHGMDEATVGRMFDAFFTTKEHGLGLGLGAVPGILEAHCGAIWVESTPGEGTRVTVGLPPAVQDTSERRRLVLVVDDERSIVDVTSRAVRSFGYDVAEATSGEEALARFRERQDEVACVLLDYTMPRADGTSVLNQLRGIDAGVPVVLLSGYAIEDISDSVAGIPHVSFLQKPYTIEALREVVRAAARP